MITLLATVALGGDCPTDVPLTGWSSTLGAAEEAYRTFDAARFDDTLDTAALDLRCLSDVVSPNAAARFHVLSGLRSYIQTRTGDAVQEFVSARAADPTFVIDDRLIPPGHEVRALVPAAVTGATEELPEPALGITVAIDGTPASSRPIDRPVIVQVVGPDGGVRESTYMIPGDPMPPYPTRIRLAPLDPVIEVPALSHEPPQPVPRRPKWGVLGASGVAAGASVVLYAIAARSEAKFNAQLPPEYGKEELVGLRNRTNGFVFGSVVAGSLATGGMVLFVVSR